MASTGEHPPIRPPTAAEYTQAGLSWFDYYGERVPAIAGADRIKGLTSVAAMGDAKNETSLPENQSLDGTTVVGLRKEGTNAVREMPRV